MVEGLQVYNAGDRKDIRRAEKDAAIADKSRVEFVVAAMSTIQGRSWFLALLESCHIFSDPFTGNALLEAYTKGERNVGLGVYRDIVTHCPNYFVQMMKESQIKDLTNDRRRDNDRTDSDDPDLFDTALGQLPGRENGGWDAEGSAGS